MAITVKHKFVSAIPDGTDATVVRPSNWNDDHDLVGTVPVANGGTGVTTSSGANSVVLRDANVNINANAFNDGYTNTAASGTQIVLTASSVRRYTITGSGGQTIKLPDATTLVNGEIFEFDNNQSSGAITVNNNSNTLVVSVPSGGLVRVNLLSNSIAAGSWDRHDYAPANVSWSTNTFDYAGSITSATWNGNAVAINRGGTGASTASTAFNNLSPLTTAGDTLYGGTSGAGTRLAIGTAGQVLTVNSGGTAPQWSTPTTGTVTSVTGTSPVVSSGGTTPAISMPAATGSVDGYLTSADWTTFNGKGSGTVTSVAATVPSVLSITGSPITTSGTLAIGYSGTALPVANGGTGATTIAEAFSDLTPLTLTTASATTLVLTNTSGYQQQIIGSANQTITLPSTATLAVGWSFLITNGTGFTVTVNTSTGLLVYTNSNIGSYRVWCISTANNNAASWSVGAETFSFETGTGSVVRATSPTIASPAFTSPSATGQLGFSGSTGNSAQFATAQTTGNTTFCSVQTSGTLIIGGVSGTGTQTIGRSTVSQQTDIQAGATASGSTKAINLGTGGLAGSTTNIAIGSTTGTSITTLNGVFKQQNYTVATLPSASTSGVGARSFVTDALAPTFGSTVVTGGAVAVPVYSDGTNWKVG